MTEFSLEMLRQALVQHRGWAAAGFLVPVSVNIGPGCVANPDFPAAVSRLLAEEQVPGRMISLEVSEETGTSAISARFFAQLAATGIQFSLDDFGTGFASLESLGGWPINELKLDSSIVRPIVSSRSFRAIVGKTIDLAHELGVKVVGEGVESAVIRSELEALGCDIGQGFYLGRPMPAAAFTAWVRDPGRLTLPADASGYPQPSAPRHRAQPRGLVSAPVGRAVGALGRSVQQVGGRTVAAAVLVLVVYALWQIFRWGGRAHQAFIGDLAFVPVNAAAVALAWRVSRRADLGYRTCRAWRLLSLAMFLYLLGDLMQFWIESVMHRVGLPHLVRRCLPRLLRSRLLRPGLVPCPSGLGLGAAAATARPGHGVHRRGGADLVPGARAGRRERAALRPVHPRHLRLPGRRPAAAVRDPDPAVARCPPVERHGAADLRGRPAALHRRRPHLRLHDRALDLPRRRSGRHAVDARGDRRLHLRRQPAADQADRDDGQAGRVRSRAAVLPALRGRPEQLYPAGRGRVAHASGSTRSAASCSAP